MPSPSWHHLLQKLKLLVEAKTESSFNSVLANYYENGNKFIPYHADNEPELGDRPIIASISVGAERTFLLKQNKSGSVYKVALESGSLIVMSGYTQSLYKHALEKSNTNDPRLNFTFRNIH